MPSDLAPIPRRPFAIGCGVGAIVSIGLGLLIASAMGGGGGGGGVGDGGSQVLISVGFVLAVGAALSLVPLAGPPLVTPERWGLVVMGVSAVRTFAVLGMMLLLLEGQGLPRKPVVYAILAGTFVMMVVEASVAVYLLGRREQARVAMKQQNKQVDAGASEGSPSENPGSVA